MPSKEEFESLISELGLQMPESSTTKEANDFSSMIMSSYDSDSDSLLSASEVSILSDEEFSALDTNSDGSISTDELSSAYDQVTNTSSNSSEFVASMPPPPSWAAIFRCWARTSIPSRIKKSRPCAPRSGLFSRVSTWLPA